jgi:hypothetical protein
MKRLYIHFINHLLPPVYNVMNGLNTTVNYRHRFQRSPRDATSLVRSHTQRTAVRTAYFYEYVQLAPAD